MKMMIFCVRDRATDQFGNPMFLINQGQAIRSFSDEVNRNADDNMLFKHPDDYDLYVVGQFDTDHGTFDCHVPEQIAIGKSVKL